MGLGAYSAEKQPGFDGKARALVSVEARDVMPGVHFGIVSDVDVNPSPRTISSSGVETSDHPERHTQS